MATLMERRKQKVIEPIDMAIVPEFKAKKPSELPILSAPATHIRLGTQRFSDDMVVHHCLDIRTKELFLNPEILAHDPSANAHAPAIQAPVIEAPAQRRDEAALPGETAEVNRKEDTLSSDSTCDEHKSPEPDTQEKDTASSDDSKLPFVSPIGSDVEDMARPLHSHRSESLGACSSESPKTPCNVDAASAAWGESSLMKKRKKGASTEGLERKEEGAAENTNKTETRVQAGVIRLHPEPETEIETSDSPVGGTRGYKRRRLDS